MKQNWNVVNRINYFSSMTLRGEMIRKARDVLLSKWVTLVLTLHNEKFIKNQQGRLQS